MRQVLQDMKKGELLLQEVAAPGPRTGHLLIETRCSLISAGTERMVMDFGRASYLDKARQHPDKVKQVIDKVRSDGLVPTLEAVRAKLEQPVAMGYSNVGVVIAVGQDVDEFKPGDRVASNGPHAETVLVPKHLCARIPDGVADEAGAFTIVSSIGLQGIRLIQPTLGETVVVFGLGLIGLLSVQILRAAGARVIGFDFDSARVELARSFGAIAENLREGVDPVRAVLAQTAGVGADAVLITAATPDHELIHQAAELSRKRGRIVLTGVVGLNLRRSDFYEKELTFQVSCSYGPGRYDPFYEEQGHDYPLPFVRWTEQRNMEAVLELMRDGRLKTEPLLSRRVPFADAQAAYDALAGKSAIGILLEYPARMAPGTPERLARIVRHAAPAVASGVPVVGLIGAGGFTQGRILPGLRRASARMKWIASARGTSAAVSARRFGIENSTTEAIRVFDDPEVNAVFVTTRHDSHARYVIAALEAGKNVFVEKPLCITRGELERILEAVRGRQSGRSPILMVGFNRRFAPLVAAVRTAIAARRGPASFVFTCNAGFIDPDHWVHDPAIGGGRIIGEACHFVDLLAFLAGAPVRTVSAVKHHAGGGPDLEDSACIQLGFDDGSIGTVQYFAGGAKAYPKERLEVHVEGRSYALDNFRRLSTFGTAAGSGRRAWVQDKGHQQGIERFLRAVAEGGESPTPLPSLVNATLATLAAVDSMRGAGTIDLREFGGELYVP